MAEKQPLPSLFDRTSDDGRRGLHLTHCGTAPTYKMKTTSYIYIEASYSHYQFDRVLSA